MKFITEDDLRDTYRKCPFTVYEMKPGYRLTPGGRQFLNDRGIGTGGDESGPQCRSGVQERRAPIAGGTSPYTGAVRSAQALFLQTGSDLLELDVLMAQEVFELERCVAKLVQDGTEEAPVCQSCTGFTPDNWNSCLGDCFEVTGFHAQSLKGREIVRLHLLRCKMRELGQRLPEDRKAPVNRIVNRLSQMICLAFGGKTCQKMN